MANPKGSTTVRNFVQNGKSYLLPPKSPFPSITSFYSDYGPNSYYGSKSTSKGRDVNSFHQRTSSESLIEEQPSWLDELLNEPETPIRKGHRRSSSDSFAYYDVINDESKFKFMASSPLWGSQNLDLSKESHQGFQSIVNNTYGKFKNRALEKLAPSRESKDRIEMYLIASKIGEKQDRSESGSLDSKTLTEKKEGSHAKIPSENDTKRAKQQFAQRSRVRKLQYIAELERNVQALQAEGSEVSAELEFLNQQNVILSMENKALKQRLESLAQEKLIKNLEHEVLEREISRLRSLYQQQQQLPHQQQMPHQRPSSSHRRTNSRDLDLQFSNLKLNPKEAGKDSFSSPVGI